MTQKKGTKVASEVAYEARMTPEPMRTEPSSAVLRAPKIGYRYGPIGMPIVCAMIV